MRKYKMWQVDSFSRERFNGNPCGIVFESDSLSDIEMQTIARQLNLSETVFICKPTDVKADYLARIFTPRRELPFAGHPTIAAAFSYYSIIQEDNESKKDILKQECGIGIVFIDVGFQDGAELFTIEMGNASSISTDVNTGMISKMLSISISQVSSDPIEVCSVGLPWLIARINSLAALKAAVPNQQLIEEICRDNKATGLTVYSEEAEIQDCSIHVRSFAPAEGVPEDPVCGSCNGAVAVHRSRHSMRGSESFSYRAEQGIEVGRKGILFLSVKKNNSDGPKIRLGGNAVRVIEGTIYV